MVCVPQKLRRGSDKQTASSVDRIVNSSHALFLVLQQLGEPAWMELDLSMAQLKTLFVLVREGPTTVGDVAQALEVGLPTASHLIEKLVQSGMATRANDPADRRRTLIRLTGEGESVIAKLRAGPDDYLRRWLGRLSPSDLDALARGFESLAQIAQQDATHQQAKSRSDR